MALESIITGPCVWLRRAAITATASGLLLITSHAAAETRSTEADPGISIVASVDQLIPDGEAQTLQIHGVADADQFKRAWLQIGEGESPERWKYVGLKLKRPIKQGLLSAVALSEFTSTGVWTVRLNVEHSNGTVRSATKSVRLR